MGLNNIEYKGKGIKVTDIAGNEYIDCVGGYGTFALGHSPKEVVEAVKEQLDYLPLSSKVLLNKPLAMLSEKLAKMTPGDLQYSFICNSGTEAVEGALKLARLATGRQEIIATKNSFHGKSMGALSVTGREKFKQGFGPLVEDVKHVRFGDIGALAREINHDTAAVILEPIQGEGGIIIPPPDYLTQVRKLCNSYDVLFIADEIQTGLGRTGELFACNRAKVVPDIMTLAKALGGGVMPVGAVIATEKVWAKFNENPFIHTSTFGGNPLACIAALKTLKIISRDKLAIRAKKVGKYFLMELEKVAKGYPNIISEVRGQGLMIGLELKEESDSALLISELIESGLLLAYTLNNRNTLRFEPPLIIKREEIKEITEKLNSCLRKLAEKRKTRVRSN